MIGNIFYFPWEISLISFIQTHLSSLGIFLFSLFSKLGEEIFIVIIMGILYWGYDKKFGSRLAISVIFAGTFNSILKNIFIRRRPYFDNDEIKCLKKVEADADAYDIVAQGFSFPSGHATNTSSLFTSLYLNIRKNYILVFSIISIVLVSISRFALGVHYPTDVLIGSIEGIIIAYLINKLSQKYDYHKVYIILCLISFIGILFCKSEDYYTSLGLLIGYISGIFFEEKYVKFENTNILYKVILRTIIGALLLLSITQLLKMPFPKELLEEANALSFFIRFMRYYLGAFIAIGIYPYIFKYFNKL